MRLTALSMLALATTVCVAQSPEDEKKCATVEGKLIDASTGEPVRKANLVLMQMPTGVGITMGGPPPSTAVASDAEGKFSFPKVEPGRYMLSAEKAGYVRQQYGSRSGLMGPGTNLTLEAGQRMGGIEFRLTPQAVITGRVVDEEGEPVQHAMVNVLREMPFAKQPMPVMGMGTNDVGEFRIANLVAGKYLIRVEHRPGMFGGAQPAAAAASSSEGTTGYVATYYPGVTDASAAAPIVVAAGQQLTGIEIRLRKARVFQVSGRVQGAPAGDRLQVTLQPQTTNRGGYSFAFGGGGSVKPDGTFTIASVQPGAYDLVAMAMASGRPQFLGRTPVTVGNTNIENVVVQAVGPIDLTGRVVVEGEGAPKPTGQVMLQAAQRIPTFVQPARVDEGGAFKIAGVPREKMHVQVFGLPADLYVKSVRAGDVEVTDTGLDLTRMDTAPPLEIRVSAKGASVDGVVMGGDKPAPGAMVLLVPQPFVPDQPMMTRKTASTDQNGRFSIKAVKPGEYKVYAFDSYMPMNDIDPDQLKPFEKFATTVKLKEEAREQVELKLATVQPE